MRLVSLFDSSSMPVPDHRFAADALVSFHPQMVYFANLCVNLRDCLCDVARHVSAQTLDFLDLDEISSFLNWKHHHVSILIEGPLWMDTS
jgi:hypothetical protein